MLWRVAPRYACSCGDRHTVPLEIEADIQSFGLTMVVRDERARYFCVPRVYVHVHGLRMSEVGMLAEQHEWKRVFGKYARVGR